MNTVPPGVDAVIILLRGGHMCQLPPPSLLQGHQHKKTHQQNSEAKKGENPFPSRSRREMNECNLD